MSESAKACKNNSIMPVAEIAQRLGVSVATVERDIEKAVAKIKELGAFELILQTVQAVAERDLIQASSAECRRDWVSLWWG